MCEIWILLGEDDESNKLLGADVIEALMSTLLPQVVHKVKDSLAPQHLVAHVGTQHNG